MTVLRSGSATDVGQVRTINQDLPLERPNLYAVADGMGGHVGGEVAARVAVETLEQAFERAPTVAGLRDAFTEANTAVWHESQANADLRGMGTTLTAMALVGGAGGRDVLALANVGDSRAYVFSGGELTQVTADHSLAEERMRHGEMSEQEAAVHPQRHILTRALGVSSEVETDMWELELGVGDRVLICSDGLSNEVGIDEMETVLRTVADPQDAAQRLVDVANEHGGADNITVVIVDVQVGAGGEASGAMVTPLGLGAAATVPAAPPTAGVPAVPSASGGEDPGGSPQRVRRGRSARRRARRCVLARAWTTPSHRVPSSSSAANRRRWQSLGHAVTSSSWARPPCRLPAPRPGSLPPRRRGQTSPRRRVGAPAGGAWGSRAASRRVLWASSS